MTSFREMRRKNQLLPETETRRILESATSGVLSLAGDQGYPYGVPLSFLYEEGKLYFHCAKEGHKIDAIRRCQKASFCVIHQDQIVPEKRTTWFRSVVAFGTIRVLEEEAEIAAAAEKLALKYCPDDLEGSREEIRSSMARLCLLEMEIQHLTGKEAVELMRQRKQESQA